MGSKRVVGRGEGAGKEQKGRREGQFEISLLSSQKGVVELSSFLPSYDAKGPPTSTPAPSQKPLPARRDRILPSHPA